MRQNCGSSGFMPNYKTLQELNETAAGLAH
jgi:hypothetical protein